MKFCDCCSVNVFFISTHPFQRDAFFFHVPLVVLWYPLSSYQSHELIMKWLHHALMCCTCRMAYVLKGHLALGVPLLIVFVFLLQTTT